MRWIGNVLAYVVGLVVMATVATTAAMFAFLLLTDWSEDRSGVTAIAVGLPVGGLLLAILIKRDRPPSVGLPMTDSEALRSIARELEWRRHNHRD